MTQDVFDDGVRPTPAEALERIEQQITATGTPYQEPTAYDGCNGRTMFDSPGSEDTTVTVLLPADQIASMPAQSLVRIVSQPDGRRYLGVVVKGPFAEPDGLRADAPVVVTTTVRGGVFMPRYHGRVQVELLGEELREGVVEPHRFRPLPNSPVFVLQPQETAAVLRTKGSIRLGLAAGQENLPVAFPLDKSVLPRHTGVLGTTGGGKSTTVSGLIGRLQQQGAAVLLIDTEGEYTQIDQPTDDPRMLARLQELGHRPQGVADTAIYYLIGRDTANPQHPRRVPFSLCFSELSPYAYAEILNLNEAQLERFLKAYDVTKLLLERCGVSPIPEDAEQAPATDEFERGWPGMTLQHLADVVTALTLNSERKLASWRPKTREFATDTAGKELQRLIDTAEPPGYPVSWRVVRGKLDQQLRLRVFDRPDASPLDFEQLTYPGAVSIVDLSDSDSSEINNLTIAEILRGLMDAQDRAYAAAISRGRQPTPLVIFIEEAHEFLSAERITKMRTLFEQVARIARRGRKRWLGLVFVTQLPQHLPPEVLGLVNNWVLHKVSDADVIARLRRSVGAVDESLWQRLPSLAPGQAVVAFSSMTRPLLVAIDPTPARLRMVE